ncbi:hypothetical protein QYE76_068510 [Lolium multiflorum]|uniref:CCHC-type domain-containing protein n=1 Tax=Lolium multiflorum TaxID=4521 RepID=A0AAD8WCP1_LOLMU|nr:hypothetical protein QYE76_068510 [Lolium multiflorum]
MGTSDTATYPGSRPSDGGPAGGFGSSLPEVADIREPLSVVARPIRLLRAAAWEVLSLSSSCSVARTADVRHDGLSGVCTAASTVPHFTGDESQRGPLQPDHLPNSFRCKTRQPRVGLRYKPQSDMACRSRPSYSVEGRSQADQDLEPAGSRGSRPRLQPAAPQPAFAASRPSSSRPLRVHCPTRGLPPDRYEEIKELEAQVLSLKKDLEKRHEGKSALDKMLSVQQSPNDKSGLGFNSNNKNKSKSKSNKKKGQDKVKDPAKLVCFKCKVEGHHVRSCPLKKKKHLSEKQQGKRPQGQGQAHARPQVEDRPLPKKNQDIVPQEKKSIKKRKGNTCLT